jgi:hypothetical protein
MASTKLTCPLLNKPCIEGKCAWFVQVHGTHPQTGLPLEQKACAVGLLPILQIETAKLQRGTTAAVEDFRNESVKGNDVTNRILYNIVVPQRISISENQTPLLDPETHP